MIQALFFDLDGTLLTSEKRISDETLRDLRALHASGIKLFPATGRSRDLHLSLGFTDEILSLFEGGVYANGGVVEIGKRTEYMKLNPSSVKGILGEVAKYKDIHASLHLADGKCAFNFTLSKAFYSPWGMSERLIEPLNDASIQKTIKMLIFTKNLVDEDEMLPAELHPAIASFGNNEITAYLTDQGKTIQVANAKAGKLSGIQKILRSLNLSKEEAAVFGDDLNDMEMLSCFPMSIAMGNAPDEVKKASKYVTLSNDSGGISHALKNILGLL